ncbi:DUF1579 domain-containing protein [bacterium]|nr:DUF1579 domain-containing protein [bacterium]
MKTFRTLGLCLFALLLLSTSGFAQDEMQMSEEDMAMMQNYMEMMSPGEHHQRLDYFIGDWDVTARMFMGGPGTEAADYPGSATFEWVLGGRFIQETVDGEFMGNPYHSIGFIGYDNFRMQYTSSSLSNTSTAIGNMAGVFDEKNNAYIFFGPMDEPMTGEIGKTVKYVLRIIDENNFVGDVHDPIYGLGDTKVMELIYTRK